MRRRRQTQAVVCLIGLFTISSSNAASFFGNARVEAQDPSGGLSWTNVASPALTVSCWFKLSVPSTNTLTENMTILANSRDGNESGNFAYLIRYNIANGTIEYVTRGTSGGYTNTLIRSPYQERWYHVAVVRNGSLIYPYVDGTAQLTDALFVGDSRNTNGVSIGGWGNGKYLWGEVQEVAVYQSALSADPAQQAVIIRDRMYKDQRSYQNIKGYYKLGYSTNVNEVYNNFAANAPTNTSPAAKQGSGTISFEEVDQGGEQSAFDSRKNKGDYAIAPLSGAFSWEQLVFSRPTPGIKYEFRIGYSSANASSSDGGLGPGWRHSFLSRIQQVSSSEIDLVNWDGAVDAWVKTGAVYQTRHREYRGELSQLANNDYEWITPDRLIYHFKDPNSADLPLLAGRLYEIRDCNSNVVQVLWDAGEGYVTQIVDTVTGTYNFRYDSQIFLTNVSFQGWSVNFTYNGTNLASKSISGPPAYSTINTAWKFGYNAQGLLNAITDPCSNVTTRIAYDFFGRRTNDVDALNRTNTVEYGVLGPRLIRRTDPDGFQWVEAFDRKGRLISRKDPLGNATTYVYNDVGNIIKTTAPLGNTTTYAWDTRANKIAETNAVGLVTLWAYHPFFNKPTAEINPLGWVNNMAYDSGGNVVSNWDAIGRLVTYTYTTNGLVSSATDGNGNVSRFVYSSDGFMISKTDPATNTWWYNRNELGWLLSTTNPLAQVTRYTLNINGNVVQTVDPLSRIVSAVYDANGNVLAQSDAKSQWTYNAYDAEDQKTQTIDRAGAAWRTAYTRRGQLAWQVDPLQNTNRFFYDAANRLTNVVDALGNSESMQYDANNNKIAMVDELDRRWTTSFDLLDRPVRKADPLGDTTVTDYDEVARVKTITSPNGYPSTHQYDGRGRLKRWVDSENYVWLYDYDGNGNITNVTDALGGHYVMTYGPRNERTMECNQDTNVWRYAYDELLRLKQQQDPNGLIRTGIYDAGGRPVEIDYSSGRIDTYSYDENNNPEVAARTGSGPATTTTLAFDFMDRVVQYRDHFGNKVKYAYDGRGAVTNIAYPGNLNLTQNFDALGRLTNQSDWAGRQMAYSYDKIGRFLSTRYPNGIVQTNAYDDAGRMTNLEYRISSSNSAFIALSYAYDRNGNKTGLGEVGTLNWSAPSRIDETARYTPANRLVDRVNAANTNRSFVYHYDAAGNMTNAASAEQSYTLAYDEDNRVISLHWSVFPLTDKFISNRYDVLGRRVSRTVDGVETRYILNVVGDMERILCDQTAAGQITAYYIHGPGLVYAVDAVGNAVNYHADAQANIIALTDSNKAVVAQYAYTPYGRLLGSSTSTNNQPLIINNPFTYVGSQGVMQEISAGDLYFMRARYYSAEAGVFLSTDPVKHIGPGWKTSAYAYANLSPLSAIDPRGLWSFKTALSSIGKALQSIGTQVAKAMVNSVATSVVGKTITAIASTPQVAAKTANGTFAKSSPEEVKGKGCQTGIKTEASRLASDYSQCDYVIYRESQGLIPDLIDAAIRRNTGIGGKDYADVYKKLSNGKAGPVDLTVHSRGATDAQNGLNEFAKMGGRFPAGSKMTEIDGFADDDALASSAKATGIQFNNCYEGTIVGRLGDPQWNMVYGFMPQVALFDTLSIAGGAHSGPRECWPGGS